MTLSWNPRVTEGFFLRAESFFNFATYLEEVGSDFWSFGGKSLHQQSHGESFLALFENQFEQGLYILDEPEAALSPNANFLSSRSFTTWNPPATPNSSLLPILPSS